MVRDELPRCRRCGERHADLSGFVKGVVEVEAKVQTAAIMEFKAAKGEGTALFSRFGVIDADNDVTEIGFFQDGAVVPLLIAHDWSAVPTGKGKVRVERHAAFFDFKLASTPRGRELGEWLLFDLADGQPKSQFSYGFRVKAGGSHQGTFNGQHVRFLHALPDGSPGCDLSEVSYVLRGSGHQTELISMKAMQQYRWGQRHQELNAAMAERHDALQHEARVLATRFRELGRRIERLRFSL